jgi:5-methylcytosine-specific restriction endonuclease McrA
LIRSNIKKECNRCNDNDQRILAVHHIDKNRSNNELSNLMWLCHNCHFLIHNFPDETKNFIILQG